MPPRHGRNNEEERVAQKEDQDILHFTQQPFSLSYGECGTVPTSSPLNVESRYIKGTYHKTIINP